MTRRHLILTAVAVPLPSAAATEPKLVPGPPHSPQRLARIEAFQKQAAALTSQFEARTHRAVNGWSMPYRLFRPGSSGKLPLVLYLHGAGGLGVDNKKQIVGGNLSGSHLWALPENQRRFPCFIAAPQTGRGWIRYATPRTSSSERPEAVPGIGEGAFAAADLVKSLIAEFRLDERRIYVTGNSMGGGGSWHMVAHYGDLFAAAVPCCGGRSAETGAEHARLPLWNFHGDADKTVPVEVSRERIAARRKAGGSPIYTEYPGVGHDVAKWAVTEPALPEWLFAQHR